MRCQLSTSSDLDSKPGSRRIGRSMPLVRRLRLEESKMKTRRLTKMLRDNVFEDVAYQRDGERYEEAKRAEVYHFSKSLPRQQF